MEYYGLLNEFRGNITSKPPVRPDILIICKALKSMNINLVEGDFMDQPYIWTYQYLAVEEISKMMEAASNQNGVPNG